MIKDTKISKKASRYEIKNPEKLRFEGHRDFFFIRKLGQSLASYGNINWDSGWILGKIKNVYLTIHLRPKRSKDIKSRSTYKIDEKELAIIIQGPVDGIEEFVEETVKLYRNIFDGATIILSTWAGSNREFLRRIENRNVVVLVNDPVEDPGWWNINLQTKSTSAGISYAKDRSIKYCLKTRTDNRIYKPNTFPYLKSLLDVFPIDTSTCQQSRLVSTSMHTIKYRIYGMTDVLMFGETNDMEKYWSSESFKDGLSRCNFGEHPVLKNGIPVVAEIFLCARYLHDIGEELQWTLGHWWEVLRQYFCVIDADSIDFLDTKYDCRYEKRFYKSYTLPAARSVEFSDWLYLYSAKDTNWEDLELKEEWAIMDGELRKMKQF